MRGGFSFPSYAALPTWTFQTAGGVADANFPLANLTDLRNIRRIFKTTGPTCKLQFNLPSAVSIGFVAVVHHNSDAGDTVRLRLWSDNNPDPVGNLGNMVYDSGTISMFPGASDQIALYPQSFPILVAGAPSSQSGLVNFSSNAAGTWQIGGIEISGWYQQDGISVQRTFGLKSNDVVSPQPFGVQHVERTFSPRILSFSRDMTDQSENATTAADFQLEKTTSSPFVWVSDIDDVDTYQREVILMRNAKLTAPLMLAYPTGKLIFDLIEHLR